MHRTLLSIVHDLAHGVFHFEGKIWRTMPMLMLHPGQLTRRYIDGQRARFVSPLALFLFTVFLMFATFEALGPGEFGRGIADGWNAVPATTAPPHTLVAQAIAAAERDRASLRAAGRSTVAIDGRLAKLRQRTPAAGRVEVHSKVGWLDAGLQRARENPRLTVYQVQGAAYKYSWALIVLSTPLVALLFLGPRRFGLYDHATFVTYSIAFMSLLAIVLQLIQALNGPPWLFVGLLVLVPPAHMFVQLRGAYVLSLFGAAWRTVLLLAAAWLTLAAFVVGVIALEVT